MLDTATAYVIAWLPTIIGLIGSISVVASCIANWKKVITEVKQSDELSQVLTQNKILLDELRKANKLNRELLTKIDKIQSLGFTNGKLCVILQLLRNTKKARKQYESKKISTCIIDCGDVICRADPFS